jgi:hypothetical protein
MPLFSLFSCIRPTPSSRPLLQSLRSLIVISGGLMLGGASSASATILEATASPFTGDPIEVGIRIDDEQDPGNLVITLEVAGDERIGDLRGFFAQISDESLLSGLSVTGDQVTDSYFAANNVINLGGGSNLNGGGSPCRCDLGIEIGDPGIGQGDDYQSVTFTLTHASVALSSSLFRDQDFGVRVTSVGDLHGGRGGSSKLIGVVPEPSTALLLALGLASLAGARPRA